MRRARGNCGVVDDWFVQARLGRSRCRCCGGSNCSASKVSFSLISICQYPLYKSIMERRASGLLYPLFWAADIYFSA